MKVMMKRPVTSTDASEARNSTVVSLGFSSSFLLSLLSKTATRIFLGAKAHLILLTRKPGTNCVISPHGRCGPSVSGQRSESPYGPEISVVRSGRFVHNHVRH